MENNLKVDFFTVALIKKAFNKEIIFMVASKFKSYFLSDKPKFNVASFTIKTMQCSCIKEALNMVASRNI